MTSPRRPVFLGSEIRCWLYIRVEQGRPIVFAHSTAVGRRTSHVTASFAALLQEHPAPCHPSSAHSRQVRHSSAPKSERCDESERGVCLCEVRTKKIPFRGTPIMPKWESGRLMMKNSPHPRETRKMTPNEAGCAKPRRGRCQPQPPPDTKN